MIQISELGSFEYKKETFINTLRVEFFTGGILVSTIACEKVVVSETFGHPSVITLCDASSNCIGYFFDNDKMTIRIIKAKEDEHYGTPKAHGSI